MPIVVVPTAYRGPTGGEGEIEVAGQTVLECLKAVEERYPGFIPQVLDAGGSVQRFVKLFVNEEQIEAAALDTPVVETDRVEVLAAIAGG